MTANSNPSGALLDGYLGLDGIAAELKVTTRTIQRLMSVPDGLPFTKIGKSVYFRVDHVKAWIASRETQRCPTKRSKRAA